MPKRKKQEQVLTDLMRIQSEAAALVDLLHANAEGCRTDIVMRIEAAEGLADIISRIAKRARRSRQIVDKMFLKVGRESQPK